MQLLSPAANLDVNAGASATRRALIVSVIFIACYVFLALAAR